MPNVLLFGPPGAGKGTQAARIARRWELAHVSSGDLLREHRKRDTALGREATRFMEAGKLVPDELVTTIVLDRIRQTETGLLLDGFPRSLAQARELAASLEEMQRALDAALLLEVPDSAVLRRITGRRVCAWGHPYHVDFNPPRFDGLCDVDGRPLRQREDDRPEIVRRRLDIYHTVSEPTHDFYSQLGLLCRVDGSGDPDTVWADIDQTLGGRLLSARGA